MKQEKNPKSNSLKPAAPLLLHLELINSWSTKEETQLLMQYAGATRRGTITRDILIPAEMTLHQLHYAIQRLFGWQNAHLRAFRLDEKDYDRLTQKRFREWSELVGVLFRGIVNDFEDQFWDDDYSGGSLKTWLRKKYTGPAVDGSYSEDFEIAQDSVRQLISRFPEIAVKESFHDYYERIKDHKERHEEKLQTIRTAPILDLTIAELETAISFDSGFDELLERLAVKTILGTKSQRLAEYDELTQTATGSITRPVTKKLVYNYDFGDNWIVEITRHPSVNTLPEQDDLNEAWIAEAMTIVNEKHRPVCIQQKGGYVMDDVGGIGSFAAFLATINQSPDADERQEFRTWATSMGWSNRRIDLPKML